MNIELNKTYNYFDDGKIKESRRMPVIIEETIPFNMIDSETLEIWKDEVEDCYWLYAKETDYFIKGRLELSDMREEIVYFVRTLNNGWFSLGFWGGRLDLDGSLSNSIL